MVAVIGIAGPAAGATITYLSQTGSVSASGATSTLGSASEVVPISSLADVNESVSVEDGDPNGPSGTPPGYYLATAELQTTLTSARMDLTADAVAQAVWDGVGSDPTESTHANSGTPVTIRFELDSAALVEVRHFRTDGRFNGPLLRLESVDLGFILEAVDAGEGAASCGVLSDEECEAVVEIFFTRGLLPAGEYIFRFDIFAFENELGWSCAAGCGSAGGTASFSIVPEPTTALLLAAGLTACAVRRRSARIGGD